MTYVAAPKTQHKEFLGVPGAIGISLLVPFFSYFFDKGCSEQGCPPLPVTTFFKQGFIKYTTSLQPWLDLYDADAMKLYLAWYTFCVVCWFVLPGKWVEGLPLRNGKRLSYKINGSL
jgi:delta14-sterol reductase